jgi:hypothetical protein
LSFLLSTRIGFIHNNKDGSGDNKTGEGVNPLNTDRYGPTLQLRDLFKMMPEYEVN